MSPEEEPIGSACQSLIRIGRVDSITVPSTDLSRSPPDPLHGQSTIHCDDCRSELYSESQSPSFLLLDQLSVPVIGCDDHVEQFASVCSLTAEDTAELLSHRPAGGIPCPGCRLAPYNPPHPVIPVGTGATVVLACPEHQSKTVDRFRSGSRTQQRLTADLDPESGP